MREGLREYGEPGSGNGGEFWWLLEGIYTPDAARTTIEQQSQFPITDAYYGGPGQPFVDAPRVRYSRTRTLVTQHGGLDI